MIEKYVSTRPSAYFIQDLKERMSNLVFTPMRTTHRAIFISRILENCEFVFLSFHNANKALAGFTKLSYINDDNTATLSLTDASDLIATVLQQIQNGFQKPISFFFQWN